MISTNCQVPFQSLDQYPDLKENYLKKVIIFVEYVGRWPVSSVVSSCLTEGVDQY